MPNLYDTVLFRGLEKERNDLAQRKADWEQSLNQGLNIGKTMHTMGMAQLKEDKENAYMAGQMASEMGQELPTFDKEVVQRMATLGSQAGMLAKQKAAAAAREKQKQREAEMDIVGLKLGEDASQFDKLFPLKERQTAADEERARAALISANRVHESGGYGAEDRVVRKYKAIVDRVESEFDKQISSLDKRIEKISGDRRLKLTSGAEIPILEDAKRKLIEDKNKKLENADALLKIEAPEYYSFFRSSRPNNKNETPPNGESSGPVKIEATVPVPIQRKTELLQKW